MQNLIKARGTTLFLVFLVNSFLLCESGYYHLEGATHRGLEHLPVSPASSRQSSSRQNSGFPSRQNSIEDTATGPLSRQNSIETDDSKLKVDSCAFFTIHSPLESQKKENQIIDNEMGMSLSSTAAADSTEGEVLATAVQKAGGVSVVTPTYNEVDNVQPLCERLFESVKKNGVDKKLVELLVVDDESVGSEKTEKIVGELSGKGFPIRIHRRYKKEGRGLSSAVILGCEKAKFDTIVVMDSDLQHEPESALDVALPVLTKESEFAVGSRHVHGSNKSGFGFDWNWKRQLISFVATMLARGLTKCTDPMSGFFSVNKETLKRGKINPIGFKIGLEIMCRCKCTVKDVPIMFQERIHGESKLTMKQNIEYLQQLMMLYWATYWYLIMALFGLVLLAVQQVVTALTQ